MDLDDAKNFNELIVEPAVSRITATIDPLVKRIESLETRVGTLEGMTKKVMTVYSGIVAVLTFAAHYAWTKVKTKLGA